MKKILLALSILFLSITFADAQPIFTRPVRIPNSTTLPSTCIVGDTYQDNDATSGEQFYLCEAEDTWAQQAGPASSDTLDDVCDRGATTDNTLTVDGITMDANEEISLGGQKFDYDGLYFVLDDDLKISGLLNTGFLVEADGGYTLIHSKSYIGNASGNLWYWEKARGTLAVPEAVEENDEIVSLVGRGYEGVLGGWSESVEIKFEIDGEPNTAEDASDMPGRITFWTAPDGTKTLVERMRIDNAGDIIIVTGDIKIDDDKSIIWNEDETHTFDSTRGIFKASDDLYLYSINPQWVLWDTTDDTAYSIHYDQAAVYPLAFWYGDVDATGFQIGNSGFPIWYVDSSRNFHFPNSNVTVDKDLIHSFPRSITVENLVAADDNKPFGHFVNNVTITKIGCTYTGTGTTPAQISLEDGNGNAMTHDTVTCVVDTSDITFVSVTANNTLNAGELLRWDTDNTPDPETDTYCITIGYTE